MASHSFAPSPSRVIPVVTSDIAAVAALTPQESVIPPAVVRVLLVEDDVTDAMILKRVLGRNAETKFQIDHASTLAQATELMQSRDYDIAIVDVNLPDARGSQSFERLRSLDSRLPLLVLTGEDNDELAIHAVQSGAQDYVAKECLTTGAITRRIRMAIVRQERLVGFQTAAARDPLTGMPNRRDLQSVYLDYQTGAKTSQMPLCVGLIDIDHFKRINDVHGHCVGDLVLQSIAKCLMQNTSSNGWTGRFGGEEFALLTNDQSFDQVVAELQSLLDRIASQSLVVSGNEILVTASGGLVQAHPDESLDEVIARCDALLYQAKMLGRNRLEFDLTALQ